MYTDNNKVNWDLLKDRFHEQDKMIDRLVLLVESLNKSVTELQQKEDIRKIQQMLEKLSVKINKLENQAALTETNFRNCQNTILGNITKRIEELETSKKTVVKHIWAALFSGFVSLVIGLTLLGFKLLTNK